MSNYSSKLKIGIFFSYITSIVSLLFGIYFIFLSQNEDFVIEIMNEIVQQDPTLNQELLEIGVSIFDIIWISLLCIGIYQALISLINFVLTHKSNKKLKEMQQNNSVCKSSIFIWLLIFNGLNVITFYNFISIISFLFILFGYFELRRNKLKMNNNDNTCDNDNTANAIEESQINNGEQKQNSTDSQIALTELEEMIKSGKISELEALEIKNKIKKNTNNK